MHLLDDEPAAVETVVRSNNEGVQYCRKRVANTKKSTEAKKEIGCKNIFAIGILCGQVLWAMCKKSCYFCIFLSIGIEGRSILAQKFPHDDHCNLKMKKLWQMMKYFTYVL